MITRDAIVAAARGWTGTPYLHQASLKGIGTDCLGLVRGIWREVYGAEPEAVPPYAAGWAESGGVEQLADAARRHMTETLCTELRPGDLMLFRWRPHLPAKHAGIAVGQDRMVHAQDGAVVAEVALTGWWRRHLSHVFAFPGVKD